MDTIELLSEISVLKERLSKSVEVVRCKDCERSYRFERDGYLMCSFWEIEGMDAAVNADDYCSYGKRCSDETD